ncbi:MAG TPA: hypothetical protein VN289_07440 [Paraburkholderia sp.]|jgi:hypothetical protein|nr:hypothetical protein [Paraburkholderia sp.]
MRTLKAMATKKSENLAVWNTGTLGARGQKQALAVLARFLLPTFLCGGKEK